MDILSREQLRFLSQHRARFCASFFLPTHRAGQETRQDPIRLKNLSKAAESRLSALGLKTSKAREFLAPVRNLAERAGFWRTQADGLAIFLADGMLQYFRLPGELEEQVFVAEHFEVAPLTPFFVEGGRFYVLAISHNQVRFFLGTPSALMEIEPIGVPRSVDEALKYDVREAQLQVHSGAGGSAVGKEGAVFTGQGVGVDDEKARTLEFVLQVERGIRRILRDRQAPMILAGVTELLAVYRSVNKYDRLLEQSVTGNPDLLKPTELQGPAWEIARAYFDGDRVQALSRFRDQANRRTTELKEILSSAFQGRIDSLFLPRGIHKWGSFQFEDDVLNLHTRQQPGDEDLANLAAIETILNRGAVYSLQPSEIPDHDGEMAATLRY